MAEVKMDSMFLKGLTGEVVTPKAPIYEEARQGWNRAVNKFPLVIVYCEKKAGCCEGDPLGAQASC